MADFDRAAHRQTWYLSAFVVLLMSLLAILAVLQYQWIGKVSAAESEKMHRNLEMAGRQLRTDLNSELSMLRFAVTLDNTELRSNTFDHFSDQYSFWRERSAYPGLVSGVYLYEPDVDRVRRFDDASRTFLPLTRPEPTAIQVARQTTAGDAGGRLAAYGDRYPYAAMVVPVTSDDHDTAPLAPAYTVVTLDTAYLLGSLLPALVSSHFGSDIGPDFDVYVVDDVTGAIEFPARFSGSPESSIGLDPATATGDRGDLAPALAGRDGESRVLRTALFLPYGDAEWRGRGWVAGTSNPSGWELVVRRRSGPLDHAVIVSRTRNIAISSGILVLLGASLLVLTVLYRRERRLAQQKHEFVAAVTHELRTPLAVVQSAAENLEGGMVREDVQVRRYGQTILSEGRRLRGMVERILLYSGIQSFGYAGHRERVQLGRIVREVVARLGDEARSADVELLTVAAENVSTVTGDAEAIRSVVENLVSNAIKHGGTRRLGDGRARVEIRLSETNDDVVLAVRDNGQGIPRSEIKRIFEPFFRGGRASERQIPGSGLGLCLVRTIVTSHDGRIEVRSDPSTGTEFTVMLPRSAGRNPSRAAGTAERG